MTRPTAGRPSDAFDPALDGELPPPHLYQQLRAAIDQEPAARPPRRGLQRSAWVALPLLAVLLITADAVARGRALVRADALALLSTCLPSALGALLLAVLTTVLALSPGPHGLGQRVGLLRLGALSVVPLSLAPMLLLALSPRPAGLPVEHVDPWGVPCLLVGSSIAALSLVLLVGLLRHSVPAAVGWRSAVLGSAAAAWSGLALLLHCPGFELRHLLVGHLLPIVLFPLIGALLAARSLRL